MPTNAINKGSMEKIGEGYRATLDLWPLIERANYLALLLMEEETGVKVGATDLNVNIVGNSLVIDINRKEE